MAKRKDVIGSSMNHLYRNEAVNKVQRAARQIINYLTECPVTEHGPALERIAAIITAESARRDRLAIDRRRHEILGMALGEFFILRGATRIIVKYLLRWQSTPVVQLQQEQMSEEEFAAWRILRHGLYRAAGTSSQSALALSRVLFREIAHRIRTQALGEKLNRSREEIIQDSTTLVALAYPGLCPNDEQHPEKGFLLRLLEVAGTGNDEVDAALVSIDNSTTMFANLHPDIFQRIVDRRGEAEIQRIAAIGDKVNLRTLLYDVPENLRQKLVGVVCRSINAHEKRRQASDDFRQRFLALGDGVRQVNELKAQQILDSARYLLRADGQDSCLVHVSPLVLANVQSFSFYPEGERYHDAKLTIVVKEQSLLLEFWGAIRDFRLSLPESALLNLDGFDRPFLIAVFECIVLDALHRILVGKRARNLEGVLVDKPERKEAGEGGVPRLKVNVRAFMRPLPIGFEASEAAERRSLAHFGFTPPEGWTFVKPHERYPELPAGKPAPLFEYSDATLLKRIELFLAQRPSSP